jgi:hypothetical protein
MVSKATTKNQISIHPRTSVYGWAGAKKNTCEPHKGKGKLAKKQKRLTERRTAHSATLKSLPSNANPTCFRAPGSMKQKCGL